MTPGSFAPFATFALYATAAVVLGFGGLGFARGLRREVGALASLVVGWALILALGPLLVTAVNRVYLIAAYTARGGFDADNPATVLRSLQSHPLVDPASPATLYTILFAVALLAAYGLGSRLLPGADSRLSRLLGLAVGLMNGYLVAYALLRYAAPAPLGTTLGGTTELVGQYAVPVLVAGAAIVFATSFAHIRGRNRPAPARPARARTRD